MGFFDLDTPYLRLKPIVKPNHSMDSIILDVIQRAKKDDKATHTAALDALDWNRDKMITQSELLEATSSVYRQGSLDNLNAMYGAVMAVERDMHSLEFEKGERRGTGKSVASIVVGGGGVLAIIGGIIFGSTVGWAILGIACALAILSYLGVGETTSSKAADEAETQLNEDYAVLQARVKTFIEKDNAFMPRPPAPKRW